MSSFVTGCHLPAALYSNAKMLPTTSCSMGKVPAILSMGRCPHVHAVLQDTRLGARRYQNDEPPNLLSSASSLARTAEVSSTLRALSVTNSSAFSSLSNTNNAFLFPRDFSSCLSTSVKDL